MIKSEGPFVSASGFVKKTTPGATEAERTEKIYSELIEEIKTAGACLEDVVEIHQFRTSEFDVKSARDAYVKFFKPIMPLNTAVTFEKLEEEDAVCKLIVTAIKGSSTSAVWNDYKLARKNYSSGSPLEAVVGYSRMVKVGPFIFIGGTTSVLPDGTVAGNGVSEEQDAFIWNKMMGLLEKAGGKESDVVRVKKYNTPAYVASGKGMPLDDCSKPFTEVVPVSKLTREGQLLEVEVKAVMVPELQDFNFDFE